MKKLTLTLTLLFVAFNTYAQTDSLKVSYDKYEKVTINLAIASAYHDESLTNLRYGLLKHYQQHRKGTNLIVTGAIVNGMSFMFNDPTFSLPIVVIGSTAMLAGLVVQIDSHKHIGFAADGIKLSIDLR
jgi:hypothetical protein